MERKQKKTETKSFDVTVELQEFKDQKWPNLSAYAFSKSGRLIAKVPLKQDAKNPAIGKASFKVEELRLDLIVKVGPDIENANLLQRYN